MAGVASLSSKRQCETKIETSGMSASEHAYNLITQGNCLNDNGLVLLIGIDPTGWQGFKFGGPVAFSVSMTSSRLHWIFPIEGNVFWIVW